LYNDSLYLASYFNGQDVLSRSKEEAWPMTDRVGQQLGNYRLLRLLGRGGFADGYLGKHLHLNTLTAIKVLQVRLIGKHLEQFRTEARAIASLTHPHIVRVLDFGVESGVPFLVMEYAPHGTLRRLYSGDTPLSPATVVPYVTQVAAALQYAHERKLVHRDIKPENMLVGQNHEILLSDFGLAFTAQSSTWCIATIQPPFMPHNGPPMGN